MKKERLYYLMMKPFTKKFFERFYKYGFLLLLLLVVSGMIYLAIKYPREYQDYDINTPPYYSPYPLTDSCITNPEWCYHARATVIQHEVSTLRKF